ncbi:CpcT/CpeT family chromophore lyase [Okeania sp. KiyG1]|nr:CpcT/CpeT family chromophore lyase [Okeania sp. KiyG1]
MPRCTVRSASGGCQDKGIDPQTGQGIWGALMGPYKFMKCCSFSSELIL